jgi:hypothetical protein
MKSLSGNTAGMKLSNWVMVILKMLILPIVCSPGSNFQLKITINVQLHLPKTQPNTSSSPGCIKLVSDTPTRHYATIARRK